MTENSADEAARPVDPHHASLKSLVERRAELEGRRVLAHALAKLVERGEHDPTQHTALDHPDARPLSLSEALELLTVTEAIRRHAALSQGLNIDSALTSGASWEQVAAAIGTDVATAQATFGRWVDGQEYLYGLGGEFGLYLGERQAARALLRDADGE